MPTYFDLVNGSRENVLDRLGLDEKYDVAKLELMLRLSIEEHCHVVVVPFEHSKDSPVATHVSTNPHASVFVIHLLHLRCRTKSSLPNGEHSVLFWVVLEAYHASNEEVATGVFQEVRVAFLALCILRILSGSTLCTFILEVIGISRCDVNGTYSSLSE